MNITICLGGGWKEGDGPVKPDHDEAGVNQRFLLFFCPSFTQLRKALYGRLQLPYSVNHWLAQALEHPGVSLLDLTPDIAVESTQLPGEFHRDPADQILVATARTLDIPLATADRKILAYPHVNTRDFSK